MTTEACSSYSGRYGGTPRIGWPSGPCSRPTGPHAGRCPPRPRRRPERARATVRVRCQRSPLSARRLICGAGPLSAVSEACCQRGPLSASVVGSAAGPFAARRARTDICTALVVICWAGGSWVARIPPSPTAFARGARARWMAAPVALPRLPSGGAMNTAPVSPTSAIGNTSTSSGSTLSALAHRSCRK